MADIELVIKIPEEIYKASQIIDVKYEDVIQIPLEVIANGTPLPKGHGDLVDRNDLDGEWVCTYDSECVKECLCDECPSSEWQCYTNIMDISPIIEADKGEENV